MYFCRNYVNQNHETDLLLVQDQICNTLLICSKKAIYKNSDNSINVGKVNRCFLFLYTLHFNGLFHMDHVIFIIIIRTFCLFSQVHTQQNINQWLIISFIRHIWSLSSHAIHGNQFKVVVQMTKVHEFLWLLNIKC